MNYNVVGLNEFAGLANGDLHCWLCQKPVSARALFCHHCGTIQQVRNLDHFARVRWILERNDTISDFGCFCITEVRVFSVQKLPWQDPMRQKCL